jgi:hypothetical protein
MPIINGVAIGDSVYNVQHGAKCKCGRAVKGVPNSRGGYDYIGCCPDASIYKNV